VLRLTEQVGHVVAVLAVLDQLAGMGYLLRRKFGLRPNFTPRPRSASTQARVRSLISLPSNSAWTPNHLPHGPACPPFGVDGLRKRTEFHGPGFSGR
jgi:hypothetical protein